MTSVLKPGDRKGQTVALVAALGLLLTAATASAGPGNYKAQRFDVVARAVDGTLDVTESIAFEFQSGTFTKVWRDIPGSRTDGIQVLGATMDGVPMTPGDGAGHIAITGENRTRVEWQFAEVGASVHRFDLHYIARGVAYRDGNDDVLRWQALPSEHRYRIDASRIQFEPADARVSPLETHRVDSAGLRTSNEGVTIEASGIQSNGWIVAELHYPAGHLAAVQPVWRTRDTHARELASTWVTAAAAIFIGGLLLIISVRRTYPSPETFPRETSATDAPSPLPAALAATLTANGRVSSNQGIATILDLADRGVLTVREVSRTLGVRRYELSQVPGAHDLESHEAEAVATAFGGAGDDVPFSKAQGRLVRRGSRFTTAVNADLLRRGLIDPDRKAVRDRLGWLAFGMVLIGGLGIVVAAAFIQRFEAWPLLLPGALMVAGMVGLVVAATVTPLSDEGLVEAARWRGFKRHLKSVSAGRDDGGTTFPSRWIVYAIAVGLGYSWSRYLKRHPGFAPVWFTAGGGDAGDGFAAFVGSHAASAGGSGAGAGGAAAGGGGSGAG